MRIRNGTHNRAYGQAVEIVVDEDQHAQQHGQQLCGAPVFTVLEAQRPKASDPPPLFIRST